MRLPKFLLKAINGFYLKRMDEWLDKGYIDLFVEHHYADAQSCLMKLNNFHCNKTLVM